TGEVKLYSAIVAANLNGSTGGDGSVFANVTLSEAEVSRIFDSELNIDLQLFPNPVQEVLNINLSSQESGTANIKLINLSGQIVKQSAINLFYGQQSKSIALSNFPKGIYFLHISNGEKSIVKKILKQ
ncbi:MAG TPA: T9SS type A sorting domain-containing protein, partial [Saprospiraceae bacterium]|nr:T9SS type A sorting domain-containing protein [Saprospiraceae bacterium]